MKHYDIVFMGYTSTRTVVPFKAPAFVEWGGPEFYGSLAASCLKKRIALVTKVSESDRQLLEPLKAAGIDLFVQPGETIQYRMVFPTANVDERQPYHIGGGGYFGIDDLPPIEPCLVHLGVMISIQFIQALKARGFRLSVDMQGFMWQVGDQTGLLHQNDVPEKKEILSMVDFVKLDNAEAKILTGTNVLQDQADILEDWGSSETVITSSDGALARSGGKTTFAKFTNRSAKGRMGRGDTFFGAYLARRLDHSVEDSLRFAAALTSIKLESIGPFTGSLEDVIERIGDP